MYKKVKLKNKANLYLVEHDCSQSITILVVYPVGSRYESKDLNGVSHYIEHMMFKGTKKRKNTLALTREIDRLGAMYNAFTGKEYTGYYIKIDKKYFEKAVDILSDMLFNSRFDPAKMEREKGVIIEEIRMYNDNPLFNIENIFEDLLYNGSALGRDIAGKVENVAKFNRERVMRFKNQHYLPANMTIVAAGNIDDRVEQLIRRYFGGKKNEKVADKRFAPYKLGGGKKRQRLVVEKKKTDQAQVMLGFPAFAHGHKFNPALTVLNTVLGGSMSSRLFIQIRERRGLAYMVRSGVEKFRDTGYVYVRMGLESRNINQAIEVVYSEIAKIARFGVGKTELKDAKTHIRGSLVLSLEDSSAQAGWYAKEALFQTEIKSPEQKIAQIEQVENDQIKSAAKIFNPRVMRLAVIGDIDEDKINF